MAGKSKTPEEKARMRRRCEALARKYRDSDEGTDDAAASQDAPPTAQDALREPQDEPEPPLKASDRYPELYKGTLPEF